VPSVGSAFAAPKEIILQPYRILVTGSRDWADIPRLHEALNAELFRVHPRPLVVVHGCAGGADAVANAWAIRNGATVERHPAPWRANGIYNPQAGLLRNRQMVDLGADVCLAFIRSGSRGASHCARLAEEAGILTRRFTA
jgi:ribosomal protein S16